MRAPQTPRSGLTDADDRQDLSDQALQARMANDARELARRLEVAQSAPPGRESLRKQGP